MFYAKLEILEALPFQIEDKMKNPFKPGDLKTYQTEVDEKDTASFHGMEVHPLYSTFALARDVEWACRLFVLDMIEQDEEGIGTRLTIEHLGPALSGKKVNIDARVKYVNKNEIICTYEVRSGKRLIARGEQGQKILKKKKIQYLMDNLESDPAHE